MTITRRQSIAALSLVAAGLIGACKRSQPTPPPAQRPPGPLRVVVSIAPLRGILAPMIPPDAAVKLLIPPGTSEHGYELTPGDVASLVNADLVAFIGLGLEPRVESILAKQPRPWRTDLSMAAALGITSADSHDSHAGHDHDHDHAHAIDPHLWLDPALVKQFIQIARDAILAASAGADESSRAHVTNNAAIVEQLCDEIDAAYREKLAPFAGRSIVTHHNAWSRLAARYGLTVAEVLRPVESMESTPENFAGVVKAVREAGVKTIFIEPQYDAAAARRIAEAAGVRVETLDPLGSGDWGEMMRANLETLVRGLTP